MVPRQVCLAGDLAIIASTLARPRWIAEVSLAEGPSRPRPDQVTWDQPVRMYAREDPYGLVGRPPAADGTLPPYLLGRNDGVLPALVSWYGLKLGEEPTGPAGTEVPTGTLTGVTSLRQIRCSLPHGNQARMAALTVANAGGRHWLLDGDQWEHATSTTADDLGPRLSAILLLAARKEPCPSAGTVGPSRRPSRVDSAGFTSRWAKDVTDVVVAAEWAPTFCLLRNPGDRRPGWARAAR